MPRHEIRVLKVLFGILVLVNGTYQTNCVNFCIEWDESLVDNPNADVLMIESPEVACPTGEYAISSETWTNLNDGIMEWALKCDCGLDSWGTNGEYNAQFCGMCDPSATATNAHQMCIDAVKARNSQSSSSSSSSASSKSSSSTSATPSSSSSTSVSISTITSTSSTSTTTQESTNTVTTESSSSTATASTCTSSVFSMPSVSAGDNIAPGTVFDLFKEASILAYNAYESSLAKGVPISGTGFVVTDVLVPSILAGGAGYIARDDNSANPRIVVSIRGTYNWNDLMTDLDLGVFESIIDFIMDYNMQEHEMNTTPGLDGCTGCFLHPGFWNEASAILGWLTPKIETYMKDYPCYNLLLVGHSMGGAVSEIMGTAYQKTEKNPTVITFGSPRAGSPEWAAFVDEAFSGTDRLSRVTHIGDFVHHVPFRNLVIHKFQHPSNEFWIPDTGAALPPSTIDKCNGDEDQSCAGSEDGKIYEKLVYMLSMIALATSVAAEIPWESAELLAAVGEVFSEFGTAHSSYITYV